MGGCELIKNEPLNIFPNFQFSKHEFSSEQERIIPNFYAFSKSLFSKRLFSKSLFLNVFFPKVFFLNIFFPKVFFLNVFFPKVFFPKVAFSKSLFSKRPFSNCLFPNDRLPPARLSRPQLSPLGPDQLPCRCWQPYTGGSFQHVGSSPIKNQILKASLETVFT